jgi:hypothetical protein
MQLSEKNIKSICEYLGERAIEESEKGNFKREKRIFDLIEKLEHLELNNEV